MWSMFQIKRVISLRKTLHEIAGRLALHFNLESGDFTVTAELRIAQLHLASESPRIEAHGLRQNGHRTIPSRLRLRAETQSAWQRPRGPECTRHECSLATCRCYGRKASGKKRTRTEGRQLYDWAGWYRRRGSAAQRIVLLKYSFAVNLASGTLSATFSFCVGPVLLRKRNHQLRRVLEAVVQGNQHRSTGS